MRLFDSHNHLQRFADPDRVIADMRDAGIAGCVVNGTRENDWPQVAWRSVSHNASEHGASE